MLAKKTVSCFVRKLKTKPYKLNLVAAFIRGKPVSEALVHLQFSSKKAAKFVLSALYSAVANAEFNHNLDVDSLCVQEAYAGKDTVLKRLRCCARGRGARIEKSTSCLRIVLFERK